MCLQVSSSGMDVRHYWTEYPYNTPVQQDTNPLYEREVGNTVCTAQLPNPTGRLLGILVINTTKSTKSTIQYNSNLCVYVPGMPSQGFYIQQHVEFMQNLWVTNVLHYSIIYSIVLFYHKRKEYDSNHMLLYVGQTFCTVGDLKMFTSIKVHFKNKICCPLFLCNLSDNKVFR